MNSILLTSLILSVSFVYSITPIPQINALYSLYNQTNGESWLWRNVQVAGPTWLFSSNSQLQKDPCNTASKAWQGITCSSRPMECQTTTCNIVEIDLAFYGLKGLIPSDLYTLSSLRRLKLDKNVLQGILPSSMGSLSQLQYFDIDSNQISGTIPATIGSLLQLQDFSIYNNQISGTIPSSIGSLSQLRYFYIDNNQINGTVPSTVGSLSLLQHFYIFNNQISGTIPFSIGFLSQLQDFSIYNNQINGTVPSTVGSLSLLQHFSIYNNQISGTVPSTVGSLIQLRAFYIYNNQVSGTIPSSIGSLSQLQDFYIDNNQISGTIPSSIGSLSQLQDFSIYNNHISGTVPSTVGSLSPLQYFVINDNQISGTIPSSIGSLSQLRYFYLYNNHISGTIPSTVGSLSQLQNFYIYNNQISGTIPFSIGSLSQLEYFVFNDNQISGTIPSSMGSLSQLIYFDIGSNQVSGTIPSIFHSLSTLQFFFANSNHLSGTIPLQLVLFSALQQIFLQQNRLTGSLDRLLLDYDPSVSDRGLINLDVSGNQLSGAIPSALFLISSLDSIALSVNCFEGELPETICDAVNVSVMSLDGLGASSSCKKQFIIPLTSVSVGRMMKGSIPDCVWRLSTLESLHLAGNGLRGKIGGEGSTNSGTRRKASTSITESASNSNYDASSSFPIMSKLMDLTLSHNYLSGEIPNWLLEKKEMRLLDLSHNKLTGDLDGLISKDDGSIDGDVSGNVNKSSNMTRILKLGVNRLSGRLPPSMSEYSTLDILSGNLFSCDTIPHHDENSQYYVCGSSEYNQSMIVLGGVVTVLLLFFVYLFSIVFMGQIIYRLESNHHISSQSTFSLISSVRRWCENKTIFFHQMIKYLRYHNHQHSLISSASSSWSRTQSIDGENTLLLINRFGKSLVGTEKVFLMTTLTIIVFLVPLYVLKDVGDQSHVTHSHQYQWYFTISYLSGSVSGLLLMMLCLISLLVFNYGLWYQSYLLCRTPSNVIDLRLRAVEGNNVIKTESSSHLPPCSRQESDLDTNRRPSTRLQALSVRDRLYFCLIFFVTIVIVGTVNGLYIWSNVQQLSSFSRLVIQLSVSLFGMIWEVLLRSTFPKQLKQCSYSVVWFMSLIGVLNGVVIPCVVTSLTSPSCYQRLIIEPDDISSSYTYSYCSTWLVGMEVRCLEYASTRGVVSQLIPPFAYSYQCGSTLLTSYIPVKLYSAILAIIVNLIQVVLVFQTKVEDYSNFLRESSFLPHRQLNPTLVLISVVSNMILLLSFGLASPLLCFGICLNLIVSVSCYLIRLGRLMFTSQANNINPSRGNLIHEAKDQEVRVELRIRETTTGMMMDATGSCVNDGSPPVLADNVNDHNKAAREEIMKQFFVEMQNNIEDGLQCLKRCKWLIMGMSCLFMTILSWDVVGDKVGWERSYWIPLMGLGIMTTIWLMDCCLQGTERKLKPNPDVDYGSFGRDKDFTYQEGSGNITVEVGGEAGRASGFLA